MQVERGGRFESHTGAIFLLFFVFSFFFILFSLSLSFSFFLRRALLLME